MLFQFFHELQFAFESEKLLLEIFQDLFMK